MLIGALYLAVATRQVERAALHDQAQHDDEHDMHVDMSSSDFEPSAENTDMEVDNTEILAEKHPNRRSAKPFRNLFTRAHVDVVDH